MTLELKRIFATDNSSVQIDYELDLSTVDYAGGFPLKRPVLVKGSVSNKASVVLLLLEIKFEFTADCDRCGVETSKEYTVNLEKSLAVSIEGEQSDTIITVPEMKLDVDELVYSEVILSLPTKHLCKEDCKGICCKCGKNLNLGSCNCKTKEIDPRLAKLAELLND